MLVLTRKANESIVIGGNVVVTILEVKGDQVRIGVRAPREVTVHRHEVFEQITEANRVAAQASQADLQFLPGGPGRPAR
jgi:carbon storage regulator